MKKARYSVHFELEPEDNRRLADLSGQYDEYLRHIESYLGVEINNRAHHFEIIGPKKSVDTAQETIKRLYQETEHPNAINLQRVTLMLQSIAGQIDDQKHIEDFDQTILKSRLLHIKPRSANQYHYIKNILSHDISFGVGPSGTGKTYLAVACAVNALEKDEVQRIILVRPAVEAGEKLGFLPGDMAQKVDPYLRPLYDALFEMMGIETVDKLIQKNIIEVAPLAFMRGRTLNDAFIILDESQNTTKEQMKMFLTRIGFNSKAVITGDITQTDLPKHDQSGLRHAITILRDIQEIHFTFFQAKDVVRHPLVQSIIQAYEKTDTEQNDQG